MRRLLEIVTVQLFFFYNNVYTKLKTNVKKKYKHTTVPRRHCVSRGKIKMLKSVNSKYKENEKI